MNDNSDLDQNYDDDPDFRPVVEFMPEDEKAEWLAYLDYLQEEQKQGRIVG